MADNGGDPKKEIPRLKSQISALEELLDVHQKTALEQFEQHRTQAAALAETNTKLQAELRIRQQNEAEIRRLNRLYAVLSEVNQMLVRSQSREDIFQEACRICVEFGNFKLAWIGLHDAASHKITPVSCAGEPREYAEHVQAYSDERPEGRGPAGTAVREGRLVVSNDFLADSKAMPWLEAAEKAGIRSVAAIPFRQNNTICGILVLYTSEAQVFHDKEAALLREVAIDISFGLDRLQTEQILRDREKTLKAITESAQDAIVMIDNEGRVSFWNAAAQRIFGYTAQEACGRVLHEFLAPQRYREAYHQAFPSFQATGEGNAVGKTLELLAVRKDKTEVTVELSLSAIQRNGQWHAVGLMRDITERKENEKRFRAVIDQTFQFIGLMSPDGILLDANETALAFSGVEKTAVVNKPFWEGPWWKHSTELQDKLRTSVKKAAAGEVIRFEATHPAADGSIHYVDFSLKPATDSAGKVIYLIPEGRDITEHKKAEDALRKSEECFRAIYEGSNDAIMLLDERGFFDCNSRALQMFGFKSKEEFTQTHPADVSPPNQPCGKQSMLAAQEHIQKAFRTGSDSFEWEHRRANGQDFPAEVLLSAFDLGAKRVLQATVRDITERKRLESQLIQAQKLESIGQLAAGIAHEINTPTQYIGDNTRFVQTAFNDLTALLKTYAALKNAARNGTVTPAQVAAVEAAEKTADYEYLEAEVPKAIEQSLEGVARVSKIVRAMKDFSHPGKEELTPCDLNHAIESTLTVARNEWKYVADMETHFDQNLPSVHCLPGQFNQVILNLIVNAAHAIADVVGDGSKGKGKITITTRLDGDGVEIRIKDTGTGIPEAIRSKVFDPFFTTKAVGKGTGQGLAIARSVVVEKHGGTINFETEIGKGTTFIIRLPTRPPTDNSAGEETPSKEDRP